MNREILTYFILFLVMIALQVLICNHIVLFNVAIPIVFIYFIIRLPISINLYLLFSLAFGIGLIVDIFSDTIGVNAFACTIIAALKRPVYFAYVDRDDKTKKLIPSISSLGFITYSKFLLSMVGIYCLLAFTTEYFSFADVKEIVVLSGGSCLLTFLTLLATDCFIFPKS